MNEATHLRPLTALRFFAAMWVVLFHYWINLAGPERPSLVEHGNLGVELFFVLSGFILCHVYLKAVETGRFRYGSFLWARLARIYPLHLAVMIGLGVLAVAAGVAGFSVDKNILSWASLPANLLLVQAWGLAPVAGWNHPSWSISAEWFAYLTFPASAWVALKFRDRPWLGLGLAAAFAAVLYPAFKALTGLPLTQATIAWGALRIVPCFLLGCAAYLLYRRRVADGRNRGAVGAAIFGAGVLVACAANAPEAVIVAGFAGLILCLAHLEKGEQGVQTPAFAVYLGEISYSVYMICIPWKIVFVNGATKLLGLGDDQLPWMLWVVMFLGVIPLSAASYHLIEKPARKAMKTWAERRPRDRGQLAPAA